MIYKLKLNAENKPYEACESRYGYALPSREHEASVGRIFGKTELVAGIEPHMAGTEGTGNCGDSAQDEHAEKAGHGHEDCARRGERGNLY